MDKIDKEILEALKIVISLASYEAERRETGKPVFKKALLKVNKWVDSLEC